MRGQMSLNSYANWMRRELKKQGLDYHQPPRHRATRWILLLFLVAAIAIVLLVGHLLNLDQRMATSSTRPCACSQPWR
jgi:hypothetical protein